MDKSLRPPELLKDAAHSAEPERVPIRHEAPANETAALVAALARLRQGSVTVIGDAMLDRYIYGTVDRISPEAPIPVISVEREVAMPGGAGNVVRNLTAIGAQHLLALGDVAGLAGGDA